MNDSYIFQQKVQEMTIPEWDRDQYVRWQSGPSLAGMQLHCTVAGADGEESWGMMMGCSSSWAGPRVRESDKAW